jgi:hypothetical protein
LGLGTGVGVSGFKAVVAGVVLHWGIAIRPRGGVGVDFAGCPTDGGGGGGDVDVCRFRSRVDFSADRLILWGGRGKMRSIAVSDLARITGLIALAHSGSRCKANHSASCDAFA